MADTNLTADMQKAKRYGRAAVVCIFVVALVWPLGRYAFLLAGGAAAYFTFLYFYFKPRQAAAQPKRPGAERAANANQKNEKWAVWAFVITAVVVLGCVFFIITLISGGDEKSTSENAESSTVDTTTSTDPMARALQFQNNGQYDSALMAYNAILGANPNQTEAIYNKGLIYYYQKQYDVSMGVLSQCLSADANHQQAMYVMGHNYYDQQQFTEALAWYQRTYDSGLRDAFLCHALAWLYDNQGNTDRATPLYKEALSIDSTRTDIYTRLAELEPANATAYKAMEQRWKQ